MPEDLPVADSIKKLEKGVEQPTKMVRKGKKKH